MIPATPQAEEHTSHLRTQPFTHDGLRGRRGGRCAPPEAFWLQEDSQLTASSCSPLQAIKLRPCVSQATPGTDYNLGVGVPVLRWRDLNQIPTTVQGSPCPILSPPRPPVLSPALPPTPIILLHRPPVCMHHQGWDGPWTRCVTL